MSKAKTSRKGSPVVVSSNVATSQDAPPVDTSTVGKLAHLRDMLKAATVSARNVEIGQAALNKDRTGNYDAAVLIAVEAGNAETFATAWQGWKDDISSNKDGIAVACNCSASKPRKDGTVTYNVPRGLSTAVSMMTGAYKLGVKLTDKDGKPLTFGKIRDAKGKAEAAEAAKTAAATMSEADKARASVVLLCKQIAEAAPALTVADCAETQKILAHVLAIATGEAGETKKAA